MSRSRPSPAYGYLRLVLKRCCAGCVLALFGEADDNLAYEHDRHGSHHDDWAYAAG
jgi:hypothetical protein